MSRAWRRAVAILSVAVLVVAAHWPILRAQALALDDTSFVTQNQLVMQPGWNSTRHFFSEVLNPSSVSAYYLPLSMTSLMLDWAMGGRADDLHVFHRTNLALHVISTVLILLILEQLFGALIPAALAALLFGLHPLTVEAIASIGERKTLLATCFALLSVLSYLRYCRGGGRGAMVLAVACFALALLSKPSVTTLPLMLLLLDYWPLRRLGWPALIEKWPFLLLSIASAAITTLAVARTWEFGDLPHASAPRTALQIAYLLAFYLGKIAWPVHLTTVYPPPAFTLANPVILLSIAVALAITIVAVVTWRARAPLVGWALFITALAPTFGILAWSSLIAYDRYVYFPAFGIVFLFGAGLSALWRSDRLGKPFRAAAVSVVLIAAAAEARGVRVAVAPWKDSMTYWRNVVALAPNRSEPHNGLGTALENRGAIGEAIDQYRTAIALDPNHATARLNLGILLSRRGQADEAIEHLRLACSIEPGAAADFVQLGLALQRAGKLDEAGANFAHALALKPGYLPAIEQIGVLKLLQGRPEEGIEMLRRAVVFSPHDAQAKFALALALLNEPGHAAEAKDLLRQATRDQPEWPSPWNELAWMLATHSDAALRDPAEALQISDHAVKLTQGRDPNTLDTQAAALAALGQFERAVRTARIAVALARESGLDSLDRAIAERRLLYERGLPYIQPPLARR